MSARVNWRAWHLEDDHAKEVLARFFARAAAEFDVSIWAWVFMSNHFHAVVQSPSDPMYTRLTSRATRCRHHRPWPKGHQKSTVIGQFMRAIRRSVSVARQRELDLSGRFWEAAYDSRPVGNPVSLAVRIAYDHRNPVKAGLVQDPEDYPWSSAQEWVTGRPSVVPIKLPNPLAFDLELDYLRHEVLRTQRTAALDQMRRLDKTLRASAVDDADAIRALFERDGICPPCGSSAAKW